MILTDRAIIDLSGRRDKYQDLIYPFFSKKVTDVGPSFGLSSHGYDIRLGVDFTQLLDYPLETFPKKQGGPIIPGESEQRTISKVVEAGYYYTLEAGDFVLASSYEHLRLGSNLTGLVKDKSTYARLGVCVQNTVLEAGWYGRVTLEITNHGPRSVSLVVGAGIAQVIFLQSEGCLNPYSGKYQGDDTTTLAK